LDLVKLLRSGSRVAGSGKQAVVAAYGVDSNEADVCTTVRTCSTNLR
jgi:hypothetical protein